MFDVGDLPVLTFGGRVSKTGVIKWSLKLYVRFFSKSKNTRLHVFRVVVHVISNAGRCCSTGPGSGATGRQREPLLANGGGGGGGGRGGRPTLLHRQLTGDLLVRRPSALSGVVTPAARTALDRRLSVELRSQLERTRRSRFGDELKVSLALLVVIAVFVVSSVDSSVRRLVAAQSCVHGSILRDPIQPNPLQVEKFGPNPTQPRVVHGSILCDPTQPIG